jgi:hypothetical protein
VVSAAPKHVVLMRWFHAQARMAPVIEMMAAGNATSRTLREALGSGYAACSV